MLKAPSCNENTYIIRCAVDYFAAINKNEEALCTLIMISKVSYEMKKEGALHAILCKKF